MKFFFSVGVNILETSRLLVVLQIPSSSVLTRNLHAIAECPCVENFVVDKILTFVDAGCLRNGCVILLMIFITVGKFLP